MLAQNEHSSNPRNELMSYEDAANALRIKRTSLRVLVYRGKLTSEPMPGYTMFKGIRKSQVEQYARCTSRRVGEMPQ